MEMNKDSSQLLASTRPPPTGQDSHEPFDEVDDRKHELSVEDGKPVSNLSSGTPRKVVGLHTEPLKTAALSSAQDGTTHVDKQYSEEELAPLGFEPEGSVEKSEYLENSADLLTLLHSSDGRHLFRDFLVQSRQEGLLNCWLACYNYRSNVIPWSSLQQSFDRYIRQNDAKLPLQETTRSAAVEIIVASVCNDVDQQVIDRVERELWSALNSEWYWRFVNSNYYPAYCKRLETKKDSRTRKPDLHTLLEGKPVSSGAPFQNSSAAEKQALESLDGCYGQGSNVKTSSRSRDCNCKSSASDNLPVPTGFVPVTQKPGRVSQQALKPKELMRQLIPKLELLSLERAVVNIEGQLCSSNSERIRDNLPGEYLSNDGSLYACGSSGYGNAKDSRSCGDANSFYAGPSCGRYSVAGASSKSCPEHLRGNSRKYKDGAKELASAVHQALRTKLRSSDFHSGESSITTPSCQSSGQLGGSYSHRQCCCGQPNCKNISGDYDAPVVPAQPATNHRIMEWMEKNAEHASEDSELPIPSPSHRRRHRQPVAYNTSRSSSSSKPHPSGMHHYDHGYEHDRPKDHHSRSHHKSSRSHRQPSNHGYHMGYPESTTSGHWTASDSASSYMAPSVVSSSVPSSASRLWPETKFDFHQHQYDQSDTGRSGSSRKSHSSTGNNSNSQKSSNSTMVTYYLEKEPIPYRSTLPHNATLGEFKETVAKKGSFRFFFKTMCKDDDQVVYQEITNDNDILPRYQSHIVVKIVSQS